MIEGEIEYLKQLGRETVGIDAYQWARESRLGLVEAGIFATLEFVIPANLRLFLRDEADDIRITPREGSFGEVLWFVSSLGFDTITNGLSIGTSIGIALATKNIALGYLSFLPVRLLCNGITHLTIDTLKSI